MKTLLQQQRSPKGTFNDQRRSGNTPNRRLDKKQLRYIVRQKGKKSAQIVASEMKITRQHVHRIWRQYDKSGTVPEIKRPGRPRLRLSAETTQAVLDCYERGRPGVNQLAERLRQNELQISDYCVDMVMKKQNIPGRMTRKFKRRKYVRFERLYSNAMWHVDWHLIKADSYLNGMWLIAYMDDASRCITGYGVFDRATAENSTAVLHGAVRKFGRPAQMLSDHGTQFTSNQRGGIPEHKQKLTAFEQKLHDLGIVHILARVNHPQTNGKLERFFRTFEEKVGLFRDIDDFMDYYNEEFIHRSLDRSIYETPRDAFTNRKASKAIRKSTPKWYEMDLE